MIKFSVNSDNLNLAITHSL